MNTVFDPVIFMEMAKSAKDVDGLKAILNECHIQYIFYNPYELNRLRDFYGNYIDPSENPEKVKLMTDFLQTQTEEVYAYKEMKISRIK